MICGKPLDFETASKVASVPHPAATSISKGRIGPAVGGYKRTPALIKQLSYLNFLPAYDYILMPAGKEELKIDLPDPQAQALFRKCREKAMTTGDKESVSILAHFIIWMALVHHLDIEHGFTSQDLVNQMKMEYAFNELGAAVLELQERTRRDLFRRP